MASNKITINNLEDYKFTVKYSAGFKVRMFVVLLLFRLAVWVSGAEIEIIAED